MAMLRREEKVKITGPAVKIKSRKVYGSLAKVRIQAFFKVFRTVFSNRAWRARA